MRSAVKYFLGFFAFVFCTTISARATLDHDIDPANLGLGDWIYFLNDATNHLGGNVDSVTNIPSLMRFYKKSGIDFVAVKAGTGAAEFPPGAPQFTPELIAAAHKYGIKIFGYTRSDGKNVPGEIAIASKVYDMGADGFILDAEAEWESTRLGDKGPALATQLCSAIKKAYPNKFLGHSPMPIISKHASFPYTEFGLYCDAVLPQDYWKSIGVTPQRMVEWMDEEWHKWQDALPGPQKSAIKPLAPVAQGWSPSKEKTLKAEEIVEFVEALNKDKNPASITGYKSVSYWRTDLHTHGMWRAIRAAKIGGVSEPLVAIEENESAGASSPAAVEKNENEIVIDDSYPQANLIGPWQMGKRKGGFFGTNFMWAITVSGQPTATAVYRPIIPQSGDYDIYIYYPAQKNRSSKAPWFISCESGTEIIEVDETIEANGWRLIASAKHFKEGDEGFLSVSNDVPDGTGHIVVADAVKLVLHEEPKKEAGQ